MGKDQPDQKQSGSGMGFALGVAIGAAAATLLAPDSGEKTRRRAKAKLDELTGGKTPEELLNAVKQVAGTVVDDIKTATEEGKKEAAKERARVLKENAPKSTSPKPKSKPKRKK